MVDVTHLIYNVPEYKPKLPPAKQQSGGGGGGGQKAPTPVSKGAPPKPAPKQFVIPDLVHTPVPELPVVPTINAIAPPLLADNYGDPLAHSTLLSGGPGSNGLGTVMEMALALAMATVTVRVMAAVKAAAHTA